jgi:hypothetical protein
MLSKKQNVWALIFATLRFVINARWNGPVGIVVFMIRGDCLIFGGLHILQINERNGPDESLKFQKGKSKMTRTEAVEITRKLWTWIADNSPGACKDDWPEWESNGGDVPDCKMTVPVVSMCWKGILDFALPLSSIAANARWTGQVDVVHLVHLKGNH